MSAKIEGKFQEIDNKISMLWSLKGAFTKDFHMTGRTQYRAAFRPMLEANDVAQYQQKLKELIEANIGKYRKDPKYKIELKDLKLDGSEDLEIAFARAGKNTAPEVRYCRDANSIETGLSVDELNAVFKQDMTIKPFNVDLIVTPWVFEVHEHDKDEEGKPVYRATGHVRAGVTLYLKRVAGIPAAASAPSPAPGH